MAIENKKQIILLFLAVAFGIAAAFLASNYVTTTISQKTQELHDQAEQQQKQLSAQMQQRSEQQAAEFKEEIGRVRQEQQQAIAQATAAMKAAQLAAQQQNAAQAIKAKRSKVMLTSKTPAGKRAVTVMIDSLNAVGGLLNAGDFVDVIAHLNIPQEGIDKKKTLTAMIFQDLQVLAINTNLDDPGAYDDQQSTPALKVTFAVDPQEAGLLAFANKNGKLELALRAPDEGDKQTVKASTWKTLADYVLQNQGEPIDVPEEAAPSKEQPDKPYIQVFRGGKEL